MNLWNDWLALILSDLEQSQRERFEDPSTGTMPAWVTKIDAALEKMLFPVVLAEGEKVDAEKSRRTVGPNLRLLRLDHRLHAKAEWRVGNSVSKGGEGFP